MTESIMCQSCSRETKHEAVGRAKVGTVSGPPLYHVTVYECTNCGVARHQGRDET